MKIGYNKLWIEFSTDDIKIKLKKLCENIFNNKKIKKKITIGLKLEETGLVTERAVIKISQQELETKLNNFYKLNIQINVFQFRRISLKDIFEDKEILDFVSEKSYDEPEDEFCDLYILF